MGNQPIARLLPAHRPTETQNKRTQTSMPQLGFEPTIPVFELAKKVHALDRVATVIGVFSYRLHIHSVICTHLCLVAVSSALSFLT
jgi:hypothetical protein